MPDHLTPFNDDSPLPIRPSQRDRQHLPAPPRWSNAGARDRRADEAHTLAMRQEVRTAELAQVREARRLAASLASLEKLRRLGNEAKFMLEEADRRSQLMAGENPVLKSQFAVLDDALFHAIRSQLLREERP